MTATVHNLALAAHALKYTFYAVAGCLDRNLHDCYQSHQPAAEELRQECVAFFEKAHYGPHIVDTATRWAEETRQVNEKLRTDADYAAGFIGLSERYIALFEKATHEGEVTAGYISNIFAKKSAEYGAELGAGLADGFEAMNAPYLAAECRKLAL